MSKKQEAAKLDVLACADRCDSKANECAEALPTMAEQFREASRYLRALYCAITETECKHTITFTVTQAMIDTGREHRALGKYCMLCGELIATPDKKTESKAAQEGES